MVSLEVIEVIGVAAKKEAIHEFVLNIMSLMFLFEIFPHISGQSYRGHQHKLVVKTVTVDMNFEVD